MKLITLCHSIFFIIALGFTAYNIRERFFRNRVRTLGFIWMPKKKQFVKCLDIKNFINETFERQRISYLLLHHPYKRIRHLIIGAPWIPILVYVF